MALTRTVLLRTDFAAEEAVQQYLENLPIDTQFCVAQKTDSSPFGFASLGKHLRVNAFRRGSRVAVGFFFFKYLNETNDSI